MTLWHLIMLTYVSANVGVACAIARVNKAGFAGYVIAVGIGVGTGLCSALIINNVSGNVARWINNRPEAVQGKYYGLIYIGAVCCVPISVFLAYQAIAAAFRVL